LRGLEGMAIVRGECAVLPGEMRAEAGDARAAMGDGEGGWMNGYCECQPCEVRFCQGAAVNAHENPGRVADRSCSRVRPDPTKIPRPPRIISDDGYTRTARPRRLAVVTAALAVCFVSRRVPLRLTGNSRMVRGKGSRFSWTGRSFLDALCSLWCVACEGVWMAFFVFLGGSWAVPGRYLTGAR
jgi:hypothetical protein